MVERPPSNLFGKTETVANIVTKSINRDHIKMVSTSQREALRPDRSILSAGAGTPDGYANRKQMNVLKESDELEVLK